LIATPNSPTHIWSTDDDEYLQNIVNFVVDQIAKQNIKAFWLAGHSQGGMTSNRLLRTDFFASRVDGWLSLSGGRLGPTPPLPASFFNAARPAGAAATTTTGTPRPTAASLAAAMAALREPPAADFSFIFETGEHELGDQPYPTVRPGPRNSAAARPPRRRRRYQAWLRLRPDAPESRLGAKISRQ
jgi:hypothetical protein